MEPILSTKFLNFDRNTILVEGVLINEYFQSDYFQNDYFQIGTLYISANTDMSTVGLNFDRMTVKL